jgi:hypothetical protein
VDPTVSEEVWQQRIEGARRRRDQLATLWATYARLHTNAYTVAKAANDDPLVALPNGDQVKLGLIHRNIEQTMALLELPEIGLRVTATDYARELTEEDTHREAVVEAALVRSMKRSGFVKRTEEVDYIKRDGIIIGHGINYSWWRTVSRRIETEGVIVMTEADDGSFAPTLDGAGQPLMEPQIENKIVWDDVQDEHVSPIEFLFDDCARDMGKSPWHGMEKIVKAAKLNEDPSFVIPPDLAPTAFTVRDLYGENPEHAEYQEEDAYRVVTVWDKVNYELITLIEGKAIAPGLAKRGKAARKNNLALQIARVQRWPVTFAHPDDSPFSFYVPIPANDHPFGISQIEHIRNPSNEADKTRTRQANLVRQSKRIPWYRKGALDPDQLRRALNGSDAEPVGLDIPEGITVEQLFGELPIPGVNPDLYNAEKLAEETVRRTSGISEVPFGGAETATESENQANIGGARPNRKRRLLLAFYTEVASRHLDFRREFDAPGQVIRVLSADGTPLTLTYGREAFAGELEVEVLPGGEATTISPVKQKMMVETANLFLGRFSPQFDRIFARQVLTKLDFRDINKMLQAIPQDPTQYMNQAGAVDGKLRAPAFNVNDQSNGQAIRAAINAPSEGALR